MLLRAKQGAPYHAHGNTLWCGTQLTRNSVLPCLQNEPPDLPAEAIGQQPANYRKNFRKVRALATWSTGWQCCGVHPQRGVARHWACGTLALVHHAQDNFRMAGSHGAKGPTAGRKHTGGACLRLILPESRTAFLYTGGSTTAQRCCRFSTPLCDNRSALNSLAGHGTSVKQGARKFPFVYSCGGGGRVPYSYRHYSSYSLAVPYQCAPALH